MSGLLLHCLVSEYPDCRSQSHGDHPGDGRTPEVSDIQEFNKQGEQEGAEVEAAEGDESCSEGDRFLNKILHQLCIFDRNLFHTAD